MDPIVYTIGLHVYQLNWRSGDDVFNVFLASFQYPPNDDTAVLFPAFGRDMAKMDKTPFIAVCISENKHYIIHTETQLYVFLRIVYHICNY